MSILNALTSRLRRDRQWSAPLFKKPPQDLDALRRGLIVAVAARAKIAEREVDTGREFAQFGFDSLSLVAMSAKLEEWLQVKLEPTLLWDYPNIDVLAEQLAAQLGLAAQRKAG